MPCRGGRTRSGHLIAVPASSPASRPNQGLWILGGIIALAALARFATLDVQSFHHDEAITAGRVIRPSLFDTFEEVAGGERSPPLYYVFAWVWAKVFGTGEVGLRSLSALLGLAMVPVAYLLGRELAGKRVGLVLAAFVALNPYLVWYSQEARSYIVMALFATAALACFARTVRRPQARWLAGWAAFSILALASHYFAVFLIAPQAVMLTFTARARDATRRVVSAVAAVCVAGLALMPLALAQQGEGRRDGFTEQPLVLRLAETGLNFVASEEPAPLAGSTQVDLIQVGAAAAAALLFLGAIGLIMTHAPARERAGAAAMAVVGLSALLLPLLMAVIGIDLFRPRNLIAVLPPLLAVAAIGFAGKRAGRLGQIGAVATVSLFAVVIVAFNVSGQMQRKNWRDLAALVALRSETKVVVAPRNGDDPLKYYLGATKFRGNTYPSGVRIRLIDVISSDGRINVPRGFRIVEKQRVAPFFYWRLESQRTRRVRPREVRGRMVVRQRSAVLLDRATD
jgi:mannosyltransferase